MKKRFLFALMVVLVMIFFGFTLSYAGNKLPLLSHQLDTCYSEELVEAAGSGKAEYQNLLGIVYYRGEGVSKDVYKAFE